MPSTRRLRDGTIRLALDGRGGYLQSALQALDIPVESQMLVFSATSLQARLINPGNPRALFFNDRVVLGYVRNGEILEVAAQDATAGIVFYTLEQKAAAAPQFQRVTTCLGCHLNADTLGVPGLLMFSTTPASDARAARSVTMDHRMPLKERWGGWFVTGSSGSGRAHRQQRARARWPAGPRARLGERPVRAGRLPRHDERHRRADGVLASDLHDQPDDARGMGSARRPIRGCTRRSSLSRERMRASPRS